ncbi:MAG: SDR family NAD(P)-dependent oxidoreductase, partial [Acidimicrobiia bacterium]
ADLVFITGASRGLGLALAQGVPFPALVIDISRSGPAHDTIDHITADLGQPEAWVEVGERISGLVESHSPTRCVFIHAAGVLTPIGFAGEVETGAYTDNVLLNSAAGQVLGHHFLRAVHGRDGRFDLVMISSGAATSVYAGWSSYGAGKAALDQWVRNVGAEQSIRGAVRVSAIAPGVVATDMQREIRETARHDFPDVDRFHDLEHDGDLADPRVAASRIWEAIESGMASGSVLDIRDAG